MSFLSDLSPAAVVDRVIEHFEKQQAYGTRIVLPAIAGNCSYLTDKGYSCAAGCLIPQDRLRDIAPRIEGASWDWVICCHPEFSGPHNSLIVHLQQMHDAAVFNRRPFPDYLADLHSFRADYPPDSPPSLG